MGLQEAFWDNVVRLQRKLEQIRLAAPDIGHGCYPEDGK